jgi:hypothetical protein
VSSHEERLGFIRNYLGTFRRLAEMNGDRPVWGLQGMILQADLLLADAEDFHGRHKPAEYAWDEIKMCFQNAAQLAIADPSLTYYEGYAVGRTALPIHHAWCIDEDGEVVDTTWREEGEDPGEWSYLGVGFQTPFLCRVIHEKETWGVLDSPLVYEEAS